MLLLATVFDAQGPAALSVNRPDQLSALAASQRFAVQDHHVAVLGSQVRFLPGPHRFLKGQDRHRAEHPVDAVFAGGLVGARAGVEPAARPGPLRLGQIPTKARSDLSPLLGEIQELILPHPRNTQCLRAAQKRCPVSLSFSISISAPLVIVASRRIVATRRSAEARVPIDFDIANVPIYETDDVLGIVNPVLRRRQFLWLMPGPREDRREFRQEDRFDGVFYRGLFPPKNARKRSLV